MWLYLDFFKLHDIYFLWVCNILWWIYDYECSLMLRFKEWGKWASEASGNFNIISIMKGDACYVVYYAVAINVIIHHISIIHQIHMKYGVANVGDQNDSRQAQKLPNVITGSLLRDFHKRLVLSKFIEGELRKSSFCCGYCVVLNFLILLLIVFNTSIIFETF